MKSNYVRSNNKINQTVDFSVLNDQQCEEIYLAALEVLEHTGAVIHSEPTLEILKKGGCWVDGNHVTFPTKVVEAAVKTAPERICVSDRFGKRTMFLESQNVYYGPGPSNTYVLDPETGERRRPRKADAARVAKVVDALPNIDYCMDSGTPSDVTPTLADVHSFDNMVRNTTKPMIHWGFDSDQYNDIIDMAEAIAGGPDELSKNPFFILYSEPSPPLRHSHEAIDKAVAAAQRDIPVIYVPVNFAGGTVPATMAGACVTSVADSLVGLVANQLVRPGSGFIMGGVITSMDMSSTICSYGAPELSLLSAALTNVARYMGIPMFSTGGCTDSKIIDAQWAAEAAFSNLAAGLSGASLVHDNNYMEYGNTGSYDLLTANNEILGMVKKILQGVEVNDYTMAVDVIDKVGPSGHFLGEKHTIDEVRKNFWIPELMNRYRYDEWKAKGATTMGERINQKTCDILQNHECEPLDKKTCERLDAILEKAERREANK